MESNFYSAFDYKKPLSLYIHIPLCNAKCDYCAFYSEPKGKNGKSAIYAYVMQICEQISHVSSLMDRPFYTAFIGGGNPGCLDVNDLASICEAVCTNGRPLEFTTEINPESLTPGHEVLFERYLNRMSMGVQSLDSRALKYMGRNVTLEQTRAGIELACSIKKNTGCRLSFDMITCLPSFHKPVEDIRNLMDTCTVQPEHLSIYALTPEEGTAFYNRLESGKAESLPDSDKQADILQNIWDFMEGKGYGHYEVSNFAKPGFESLHNSVYWNYGQYMGLGPSSHSRAFKDGTVTAFEIHGNIHSQTVESTVLTKEQALEEFVLMGLRHREGLDLERLENEFGYSLEKLKDRIPAGYSIKNGRLVPDDRGLMTSDAAALDILH